MVNEKYAETYRNPQIEKNVNRKDAKGSTRSIIFHEPLIIDDMEKRKPSKKNIIENAMTWVWVVSNIPERVFAYFSGISKSYLYLIPGNVRMFVPGLMMLWLPHR